MAVPYSRLVAGAGLRLNALVGTIASTLETAYVKTSQVAADYESVDFSFGAIKDLVIQAEAKYAGIIAAVKDERGQGNHPWRALLHATTASIAHGGVIPSVSTASEKVIGAYGSVRDATDGSALSRRNVELVRRFKRQTWRTLSRYEYAIEGTRLYHTRANATIDVCTYNTTTRRALIDADTSAVMLLPDVLESALICEAVSMAFYDDNFPGQASQYRSYSNDQIAIIQAGGTDTPQRSAA